MSDEASKQAEGMRLIAVDSDRVQFQMLDGEGRVVAYATFTSPDACALAFGMLDMCGAQPSVLSTALH